MYRPLNLNFKEEQIMGLASQEQEEEQRNNSLFLLDALYCKEDWDVDDDEEDDESDYETNDKFINGDIKNGCSFVGQDLFWEEEELCTLFSKEHESSSHQDLGALVGEARREAVEWILRVNAHYAFSALTAILAVNYLDRFIASRHFQEHKPWMAQLVAVACLSLAAKVEETQVPLLLDLQVVERECVFAAETIQRMELLVLSTLDWKMNPVTPLSFIDHIVRRLALKTHHLHFEFMRRCECVLLSVLIDSKFTHFLPSVLATVTMLHVVDQVELSNPIEYKDQLMSVLKMSKDKVDECHQLILESSLSIKARTRKRKHYQIEPGSPNGVIDMWFSSDSSNDSWAASVNSSVSSSPEPLFKKKKHELSLGGFNSVGVAVDVLTSPH